MTTDMPADLTRVRDHSRDPTVASQKVAALVAATEAADADFPPPAAGWTPPPPQDSAYYTPLCAHRDEIAYEHTMDHVAALRRVADEIQAARHAAYPHLVTPLKKRRAPKKAAKP